MADQPTAPWWATLIAIILTAIVSVVGTVIFLRGNVSAPGAPPGIGSLLTDTITYIPHILLLFGVLADIFTMEGVYSIPSLVGVLSIPLNYLFSFFWAGIGETIGYVWQLINLKPNEKLPEISAPPAMTGGAIKDYPGCYVQGFQSLQTAYAPQTLVVTATVFSYYMFDLIANRPIIDATATIVFFGVTFLAQAAIIGNCQLNSDNNIATYLKAAMALAEGMFIGGLSYAVVQAQYPGSLPSSVINRSSGGGTKKGKSGGKNKGSSGGGTSDDGGGNSGSCGGVPPGETPGTGGPAQGQSCPSGTSLSK
jgi:hypothetical protein